MNRLVKIEWIKIKSNTSFWVLLGLHLAILFLVIISGKVVITKIGEGDEMLRKIINPTRIPVYQFPDIWQNITYVAGYLKFILGFYVIIGVTNEISFNTLRQNIMNGLSRIDFLLSKYSLILLLGMVSTIFIFVTGLLLGFATTHPVEMKDITRYMVFIPAYFLELIVYLNFALLIGLFLKNTGLSMGLLLLYTIIIEPLFALRIKVEWIRGLLPSKAINNLIHNPFRKYWLREIQDYVSLKEILIVAVYAALFIFLINLILRKRDL